MRVLLTGATGWVGGALVARLLAAGHEVVCLGRDADGSRTRRKVTSSAAGLGLTLGADWERRLHVEPLEPRPKPGPTFEGLDAAWHVAAEMSYASMRLPHSFAFNVTTSSLLYEAVRTCSPQSVFVYVSTTYTGGAGRKPIPETLHLAPTCHNAYLVTKWGAEMALAARAQLEGAVPVVIYRTPGVVGHSASGWYGGQAFGMYNFYEAFRTVASKGAARYRLDIDPETAHAYLPIDRFVDHAEGALFVRPTKALTVLHDLGTFLSNRVLAETAAASFGLGLDWGPAQTETDRAGDEIIGPNKPFNQGGLQYPCAEGNLAAWLGERCVERPLDGVAVRRIIDWYQDHGAQEEGSAH